MNPPPIGPRPVGKPCNDPTRLDERPARAVPPAEPSRAADTETSLISEGGHSSGSRDPFDRIAEEFAERCRRGEAPSIAEYEAKFPDQVERVRKLLSAVAMMEQMRKGSKQARFLPERIGEYRILRELGRGGMGVVYEAVQESLWRHVAVKAIHHTQLDAKRVQRFRREAQAVAQLHHTNIVPIFGIGEHDGVPYYAMQYIRGRGLDALLQQWRFEGSPPAAERWRFAARLGIQVAEALNYAHDQGILHRDIKPANLLIDEQEAVWVTDFGLAKMVGHDELTASGDVIGTLRYLAPEVLRGVSDHRGDIYSLGLTLYEVLTLSLPFGDLNPSELLHKVSAGQPIRPRSLDPQIPRDLETIVLKATSRDPAHRYESADALAFDLRNFLNDRPIVARRASLVERAWRWSRRNKLVAALTATAAMALFVAAVVGWTGYVRTNEALKREQAKGEELDRSFTFTLAILEEVLDKLSTGDNEVQGDEPIRRRLMDVARQFGDQGGPPTGDRGPDGPGGGFPGPPPDDRSSRGMGPGPGPRVGVANDQFPPFPPLDGGGPPGGGPGSNNQALLETVLNFYEQIARRNEKNSRLRGEAAWAYFKVGGLNERLGKPDEADQAFANAVAIFEELVRTNPTQTASFEKLVKICSAADPWHVQGDSLPKMDARLRKVESLLDRLIRASPDHVEYARALVQVQAKLGVVAQQAKDPEAEEMFRKAIELADRLPDDQASQIIHADAAEAFGLFLIGQQRNTEGLTYLDEAANRLAALVTPNLVSLPIAERLESLALTYRDLGKRAQEVELMKLSDEIDPRPPMGNSNGESGPGGPPPRR